MNAINYFIQKYKCDPGIFFKHICDKFADNTLSFNSLRKLNEEWNWFMSEKQLTEAFKILSVGGNLTLDQNRFFYLLEKTYNECDNKLNIIQNNEFCKTILSIGKID